MAIFAEMQTSLSTLSLIQNFDNIHDDAGRQAGKVFAVILFHIHILMNGNAQINTLSIML